MNDLDKWANASVDDGIGTLHLTRKQAFYDGGIATRYRRQKAGRLYVYTSEEGTVVIVGRLRDLLAEGFTVPLHPDLVQTMKKP